MKFSVEHEPEVVFKVIAVHVHIENEDGSPEIVSFNVEPVYMKSGSKIILEMA